MNSSLQKCHVCHVHLVPNEGQKSTKQNMYCICSEPIDEVVFPCAACKYITHWGRLTHICVNWQSLVQMMACLLDGYEYAGKWLIGPLGTYFSEMINWNLYIFIQENASENVFWSMAGILIRPQCHNRTIFFFSCVGLFISFRICFLVVHTIMFK